MKELTNSNNQKNLLNLLTTTKTIAFDDYLDLLAKLNDLRNIIAHGENLILK